MSHWQLWLEPTNSPRWVLLSGCFKFSNSYHTYLIIFLAFEVILAHDLHFNVLNLTIDLLNKTSCHLKVPRALMTWSRDCHHQGNDSSQPLLSKLEPSFFSLGVIPPDLPTLIETREFEYSTLT